MTNLTIVEDTRNQIEKHDILNAQLKALGCKVIRSKLYVGDYTLLNKQDVCIDTKKDILELVSDLTTQHERFKREYTRANENGIQLIILTEEIPPNQDLRAWESPKKKNGTPFTNTKGSVIDKIIRTINGRYGTRFIFCTKEQTGELIIKLLTENE